MNMDRPEQQIYADVLRREIARQAEVLVDPSKSLRELQGYIDELDDKALQRVLGEETHLKRVWGDVLTMAQLRRDRNPLWEQCEPVIRNFWRRVAPLVFREDDSLSVLLRSKFSEAIFGEDDLGERAQIHAN